MGEQVTYHSYQQILNLQSSDKGIKHRKIRKKFVKSKNGCLNCKRRRKKCDEIKPMCTGCSRNKLTCVWPDHVKAYMSPEEYKEPVKSEEIIRNKKVQVSIMPSKNTLTIVQEPLVNSIIEPSTYNFNNLFGEMPSKEEIFGDFDTNMLLDQFLNIQTEINCTSPTSITSSESLSRRESSSDENGPNFGVTIPGVPMTRRESLCYGAFLNKFMTSISPPHCPPIVSPTNVMLPFAVTHEIVREIFLACGATLAAYNNDSFRTEANERYVKVVNMLIQEIKNSKEGCEDHLFISVQLLQTLCLRDKNIIGLNATKCAAHLSAAYEMIKKRFLKQASHISSSTFNILPLDRILTEHFLINYPITIMLCRHDKLIQSVPSPFQFFEQFGSILHKPFNDLNDDPWLNHPVLGLSLKAYEIAAKCSWMCRLMKMPLKQEQLLMCLELKNQTNKNMRYLNELEKDSKLTVAQRNNVSFSKSKLYGCLIILKKLCHYETTTMESLQPEVKSMIQEIHSCKALDPTFIHSVWGLFIGGCSALEPIQRDIFKALFKHNAESIHSSLCLKIIKYLDIRWEEEFDNTNVPKHEAGFEYLFDASVLDMCWTMFSHKRLQK